MDNVEPDLRITDQELHTLHEFAVKYLAEKEAREQEEAKKLQQMREKIGEYGEQFKKLWVNMGTDETTRSVPLNEGNFLVVTKSSGRLRMAVTTNKQKNLGGYLPTFDDISEWQEVTIDGYDRNGPQVQKIYHWDEGQLDIYNKDHSIYWGLATAIPIERLDKEPADVIVQSYEDMNKMMKVPEALLSPQQ